jgi:hypothetical protein
MEHAEVKSDNARNVILSYNDKIYYVNEVKVQIHDDEVDKIKAVFRAKQAGDNSTQDLDIEINKATYDMLMEYAKLDKVDLIMILQIEGNNSKWCLISEAWLKNTTYPKMGNPAYVV